MNGYSKNEGVHLNNNDSDSFMCGQIVNGQDSFMHDEYCNSHNGYNPSGSLMHDQSGCDMNDQDTSNNHEDVPEDLYTQLAEKERNLELAAELGKALLEQNEELKRNLENIVDEHNAKLEELNEEKHRLKLQQTALESEYELTIRELQSDICQLREELDVERSQSRSGTKTQSHIVEQLMQQNERLTQQLKETAVVEEQLQTQVETLRHQVNARKTSMHEHVQQLQILRDEITLLTDRKNEIERRLLVVNEERDLLSGQLDEAYDRNLMLERHQVENQYTIRQQTKELNELRERNDSLQQHVDQSSATISDVDTSLLAELEMSTDEPISDQGPSRMSTGEQLISVAGTREQHLNLPYFGVGFGGLCQMDDDDDEDIECDDELAVASFTLDNIYNEDHRPSQHDIEYDNLTDELKQEILEVYAELQRLVLELKGYNGSKASPASPIKNGLKVGSLLAVLRELRELTEDIIKRQKLETCVASGNDFTVLENQIASLKKELCASEGQLDHLRAEILQKDEQLEKHNKEIVQLAKQICMQQDTERHLMSERDRLLDENAGIVTRDEIIEEARADRDKAIQRSQELELEVAQARHDILSMDSQLIYTIKHKLELSQQLEQWQCDMEDLVSVQVSQKLSQEKGPVKKLQSPQNSTPIKQSKSKFSLPWS